MFLGVSLQRAMKGFTERIVELMKSEDLYESQGGPIILSQVNTSMEQINTLISFFQDLYELTERCLVVYWECRLGMSMEDKGSSCWVEGHNYMTWAAKMATETGVPWVMCKEDDAPDPVFCLYDHENVCEFLVFELGIE